MANGQFHRRTKSNAIRVKNPLPLTMRVRVSDGGSFDTTRTLKPGDEVYIKVPQRGDYEVKGWILEYDKTGKEKKLGDTEFNITPTVKKQPKVTSRPGPVLITGTKKVKTRRWVTVASWLVPKGFIAELKAISIQLDVGCEAEFHVSGYGTNVIGQDLALTYQNRIIHATGYVVVVKARSTVGNPGEVSVMISGMLHAAVIPSEKDERLPEHITEQKPPKPAKEPEEETPLRSLGDMIEEMKKREEVRT